MRLTATIMSSSSSALPLPPLSTTSFSQQKSDYNHSSSSSSSSSSNHLSFVPKLMITQAEQQWMMMVSEDDSEHHLKRKKEMKRTIRYRLSELCREGQINVARQLFDTIPRPTTVIWNALIIGLICNNMPHEALLFYARMKKNNNTHNTQCCDSYTFSSTLKACAKTRNLHIGKAIHCHLLRSHLHPPSSIVSNSLLNMYTTCCFTSSSTTDDDNDHHGLAATTSAAAADDLSRYESLVSKLFHTLRKPNVITWNIIISWYVKTEKFMEAVRHFTMMISKRGIKPTPISFVNVFPAVSKIGDATIANVLYGLLLKFGSEYVNDPFAVSSAIFMYTELGFPHIARKIFDHSLDRNTEVWNTMIGGYVQNNRPVEALGLFLDALVESEHTAVLVDDVTFLLAPSAASQLKQLDFAQQLHSYIIKNSLELSVTVLNAIVVMYSRCNCIDMAFKVFKGMVERDVVSWNTMVSAFVQNGLDCEGLMLAHEMQKQGFLVDSITVTALLSAASNLRNHEIGRQTHAYLLRHGIQFEGMESYLIDMYSKSGLIEVAQRLFDQNCMVFDRDQATWNAMIAGNTQNGRIEQAFIVFRKMLEENVIPNAVTLASVLPACSPRGSIAQGKQLHGFAIRKSLDQNIFVGSALVDMYSKSGAIRYAENVFAKSPEKNSVTYTNMILGYGQHGMGEKALSLFNSMRDSGIKPDSITLVAVLSACGYGGLVDKGLQIFGSMEREYGIQPSSEHYCCVVDMLGRVGRVMEAYEFVKGLGKEGNMVMGIWGSLLAACKIHGEFELGKIISNKMLEMDWGNSMAGYHVLLSNLYAEVGNWESVYRVRKGMREKGLTKEVGCSWIDIGGYVNLFSSRDRKHPKCAEIYEMLGDLGIKMSDAGYRPRLNPSIDWTSVSEE